jgi:hypothetical protein
MSDSAVYYFNKIVFRLINERLRNRLHNRNLNRLKFFSEANLNRNLNRVTEFSRSRLTNILFQWFEVFFIIIQKANTSTG